MANLLLRGTDAPLTADAIVVPVAAGPDGPVLLPGSEPVDTALGGKLLEAIVAVGGTGAAEEVAKVTTLGALPAPVVAAVGVGQAQERYPEEVLRRASGAATRALAGRGEVLSLLALANGTPVEPALVAAVAEGALLGSYAFTRYKSDLPPALPGTIVVAVPQPQEEAVRLAARRAEAVTAAVALARDLTNTPPNDLYPEVFADQAREAGEAAGLTVEVLDEAALAEAGYGGIVGVGQGSVHPPRLVRLHYRGAGATTRVALVGKGITFDSGGLSIKPAASMEWMKSDMAGAAAVVATMTALTALGLPLEVTATVPMAENLPGSSAYRPQDVLTLYGGTTVEVLNTDAEGRLILGDAIARACEDEPAYLLETSTLTGAQLVALGLRTSAVMGSDELRERVARVAGSTGDAVWPMPLPSELLGDLDSPVADLANITGHRNGGMLAAGQFLSTFVADGVQWAHLDVAGPAYNTREAWGYTPKGGTGVPVRVLLAVLEDIAANG